ncbi:hypothetical protein GCM10009789_01730 [Kribbella sancticallisti]|uniref:NADPH2:quinone reductase n=1 Tax=Kribbella sancticallisti TaxID=460087 RepID=A0ABN2C7L5_9ACTN
MDAAVVPAYGQAPELREWAASEPAPGQTLIRNLAAAVNPVDLEMSAGTFYFGAPEPPYVAGGRRRQGTSQRRPPPLGGRVWYERGRLGGSFAHLTAVDGDIWWRSPASSTMRWR